MTINTYERPRPPMNSGRNAAKRRDRAAIATLKGSAGGWKKAFRKLQERMRERAETAANA